MFRRLISRFVRDERGSILVLAALSMVALLGIAGIAIDVGRLYVQRAHAGNIADASALSAAKAMRQGQSAARTQALAIAAANGYVDGKDGSQIDIAFASNNLGEQTVTVDVTAQKVQLFLLAPIVKSRIFTMRSHATAAVMPIDMTLVLDESESLEMANAWNALKNAAKEFVKLMDDKIDQVGLVGFNLVGKEEKPLKRPFIGAVTSTIASAKTSYGTNISEGLKAGLAQLQSKDARLRSAKVVVLFTDGQPNAYRAVLGGQDRIIMSEGGYIWGYFEKPDQISLDKTPNAAGCAFLQSNCFGMSPATVEQKSIQAAKDAASAIRAKNIYIYVVGLGNPNGGQWLAPDLNLLRNIANE
ncbi:MAG TPA: TadE/TadG family type IV pilus assembly protein, partial [Longimicrobiales bacterium]|nr:TadE/TadG family type IV pilus assembly protein [Longimicrobiales bacterium]